MSILSRAEAFWKAYAYSGSGNWLDLKNSYDMVLPGGTNDPTFFDYDANFIRIPGLAGNQITTPSSAALTSPNDVDIRWVGIFPDMTPASNMHLFSKYDGGSDQRQWNPILNSDGTVKLIYSDNGANFLSEISSAAHGGGDGTLQGIRITVDVNDEAGDSDFKFWKLNTPATDDPEDETNWTQFGDTEHKGAAFTFHNGTTQLEIGTSTGGRPTMNLHRLLIYDVIDGDSGDIVLDINPADLDGDVVAQAGSFAESSANAATITIAQSGTAELCRFVDRHCWQYDTNDFHEAADAAGLDVTFTSSYTWGIAFRVYDPSQAADAALIGKKANFTTGDGYAIYLESADATAKAVIADGANDDEKASGNLTVGKAHTLIGVVNGTNLQLYLDATATGGATTLTVDADMANAVGLRIGALSGGSYTQMEAWAGCWFLEALDSDDVALLDTALHSVTPEPSAPGEGIYASQSGRSALRSRIVYDGGTDIGQEMAAAIAAILSVENPGEALGALHNGGATAGSLPAALKELAGYSETLELEAAIVRFAEIYST